jgi:hypothetical protein
MASRMRCPAKEVLEGDELVIGKSFAGATRYVVRGAVTQRGDERCGAGGR